MKEGMIMHCRYCGAPLPEAAAFCSACGAPNAPDGMYMPYMVPVAPDPEEAQRASDILRWGIMGLAFALNFPILGIIFSKIGRNKALDYLEQIGPWTGKTKVGAILAKAGIIAGWCMLGFVIFIILYYALVFTLLAGIG